MWLASDEKCEASDKSMLSQTCGEVPVWTSNSIIVNGTVAQGTVAS